MIDKKIIKLVGNKKKDVVKITLLNIITLLLNVAFSACVCYTIYLIMNDSQLISLPILFFVIILRFVLFNVIGKTKAKLGEEIKTDLRERLLSKSLSLGVSRAKYASNATMTQLTVEGIEQLDLYFTTFIPNFIYGLLAPLILFVICLFIEVKTAVVLIIALPLIPVTIVGVSKYAKRVFAKYWGKYTSMGDTFLDSLEGMKELKIFNFDERKQKEINDSSEEFRKITMKVLVMQLASLTIMDLVAYGGAAIAIIFTLTSGNANTINALVALFLVLICADFFLPMRALGSAFHIAMNGATAGNKIIDFLNVEEVSWGEEKVNSIEEIELRNLTFSYDKDVVLNDVSIKFTKGLNGLVGYSGSGKSTIASLLIGKLNSNNVFVNNKELITYNKASFYNKICSVTVESYLFNKSIRQNFLYVNKEITDEEILKYLDIVNMKDYILSLGGLDYVLLENSENISGGQKQRIVLACNLSIKKDLYIFDEATSNIDVESEKIINDVIKELSNESIVIVISHRLQNVVNAKVINYLENGVVLESDTHETLMSNKNNYFNLFDHQCSLENKYKGETV
ncbi:MAG: ATP-binding cassette domain-containing protein [bacterium]